MSPTQQQETSSLTSLIESPRRQRHGGAGGTIAVWVAGILTLLFAVAPAVLWPGDVSWQNDEPALITNAWLANNDHRLVDRGLFGSFPVPYGVLPSQFYQLLLLFTHDMRAIMTIRAGLSAAIVAISLIWLARTLRLTPWLATAVVLSPFLWYEQRLIWDCNFLIPVSMLGVAAYASFLRTRSPGALVTALTALTLAPLIHFQALPLFGAFVGHALWRHRAELWLQRRKLLAAGIVVGLLHAAYFIWAIACVCINFTTVFGHGHSDRSSVLTALLGPAYAGRLFTGEVLMGELGRLRGPALLSETALQVSRIAMPLVWLGIAISIVQQANDRRKRNSPVARYDAHRPGAAAGTGARAGEVRRTIAGIALACLVLQLIMVGALRVPPWLHYCFGTLPIYVLFAWLAVDLLQRIRLGMIVTAALALSLGYITFNGIWQIHEEGWDRGRMSPSLANQIEVVRAMNRYCDQSVWTQVPLFQTYPHALRMLRALEAPGSPQSRKPSPHGLLIRFRRGPDPRSSRIELIEIPSEAEIPKNPAEKVLMSPPAMSM